MKPAPFDYAAPDTVEEALALLAERGSDAKPLAGGQSLVPLLNFRLARPAVLVDLNRIPGLDGVEPAAGGGLVIGAMVRHRRLERDPRVAAAAPLLAETAPFIAHPQIRNRGTVGGSLAHADPAAELPAAAVALDARLRLRSAAGERTVAARAFFVGLLATLLEPGELVVAVELPAAPPATGWAFTELARRHGDYAQAGVAVRVTLDPTGRCAEARLAFLSVGDGPIAADRAAAALAGAELGTGDDGRAAAAIAEAAEIAGGEIDPVGDIHASADYKRHLAKVLARRALATAAARARGRLAAEGGG
jgi:carbon-monoxide dehydrogenase medium subunit